jgi:hypothetical protein
MSKFVLTFGMFILLFLPSVFAQTLPDYLLETRGDTLVIKDDNDFGAQDTFVSVLNADTNSVPAGRVYLLHNGGVYTVMNNPTTTSKRKVVVMGETQTSLKINKGDFPAILQGGVQGTTTNTFYISSGKDLLVKNLDIEIASTSGSLGWTGFGTNDSLARLEVNNCIIEHNQWTCISPHKTSEVIFLNDYFVNLDGHTCRRNGGVVDNQNGIDSLIVENCTHINTQGTLYKFRIGILANKVIFNHNDFVNCSGSVFFNCGDYPNFSVTNNIFVNVDLQPFAPVLFGIDTGEIDEDSLAMGLVNIYVDTTFTKGGGSFYVDKNLTYWDPTFNDVVTTSNAAKYNGATNWETQMITMNSRTKKLFADKTKNPYLTQGTWFENVKPSFKNTDVLYTTQLAIIKEYSTKCVDTTFSGSLPSWRQASNAEKDYFCYADWPIPVDLSYTDANLLTGGLNGFPVGDLNWFPTQNTLWKAQESTELAQIAKVLATGKISTAVEKTTGGPQQFQLHQNYPNPFNPTTVISYSLPKAGYVSLKVYNMLGQEVATLVNAYKTAQTYNVEFDASKFASGVYIYTIRYNNQSLTHKMVLMK